MTWVQRRLLPPKKLISPPLTQTVQLLVIFDLLLLIKQSGHARV